MTKLLILGDTHGNMHHLQKAANIARRNKVDQIIQVGDFGFLFDENKLQSVTNVLSQGGGIPLIWFDGNHENFDMLADLGATPQDGEPTQLTELVTYSPRGYVWDFDGIKTMTLGGAFSIDKDWREPHITWWAQEMITEGDIRRACDKGKVDLLLTHDAPQLPPKLDLYMQKMGFDVGGYKTDKDSRNNRLAVTAVMQAVRPSLVIHGHFHYRYNDMLMDTPVVGLHRDKSGSKSWVILDMEEFAASVEEIRV